MKVRLTEESDTQAWDDYLGSHPDSFFCLTTAWRRVIESVYGHRSYYLMAWEGTTLRGVLPLFLIRSRLFGRVLASSPFSSAGAVCADDDEAAAALVEHAIALAREQRVDYLELKSVRRSPCQGLVLYTDYLNYEIQLGTLDTLWRSSLEKDTREAIRQAERFGLTMEQGHHCLGEFYNIMATSMRRLGTPVHSRLFYEKTLEFFGERASIVLVRHGSKRIAGALLLRHRNQVSALNAGSLREFLRLRPNNFLYWEIIKQAVACGAATLDLGRSTGSGGVKFKKSMGAVGRPLYYEYLLHRRKTLPQISPTNPSFAAARWVWQRMPLPLTKCLGPGLICSIP